MADQNWGDNSRNRFEIGGGSSSTTSWAARSDNSNNNFFDSSMDSVSVTGSNSSMIFQDHAHDNLQMMGLGLSSPSMDWNQALIRSGKHEESFIRSSIQENQHQNMNSNTNYQHETGMASLSPQQHFQWTTQQKMFPTSTVGEDVSSMNQGLSTNNFPIIDNSSIYETPNPMLQGFLGSTNYHQQPQDRSNMDYTNYVANYGINTSHNEVLMPKFSHFMSTNATTSPPKQALPSHSQLHFSNNAPYWNATTTTATTMSDQVPLSFLSNSMQQQQSQYSTLPTFDEKPIKTNASEIRSSSSTMKKSGSEVSMKRPRNESSSSPLPAFKVRKEKMSDKITALQHLVSPFGKTDTASVLSEAIEYIKFLNEQVAVLSTPYMKSGGATNQHHHQNSDKSKDSEGSRQDLRSRGLCLVPISIPFPVAHETTVDLWTPTYGGTFR